MPEKEPNIEERTPEEIEMINAVHTWQNKIDSQSDFIYAILQFVQGYYRKNDKTGLPLRVSHVRKLLEDAAKAVERTSVMTLLDEKVVPAWEVHRVAPDKSALDCLYIREEREKSERGEQTPGEYFRNRAAEKAKKLQAAKDADWLKLSNLVSEAVNTAMANHEREIGR